MDRNPFRVQVAGELLRIHATFYIRDLGGRESHDLIILVPTEERVEVMKVTSRRSHDDGFDWHRNLLSYSRTEDSVQCNPALVLSRIVFTQHGLSIIPITVTKCAFFYSKRNALCDRGHYILHKKKG